MSFSAGCAWDAEGVVGCWPLNGDKWGGYGGFVAPEGTYDKVAITGVMAFGRDLETQELRAWAPDALIGQENIVAMESPPGPVADFDAHSGVSVRVLGSDGWLGDWRATEKLHADVTEEFLGWQGERFQVGAVSSLTCENECAFIDEGGTVVCDDSGYEPEDRGRCDLLDHPPYVQASEGEQEVCAVRDGGQIDCSNRSEDGWTVARPPTGKFQMVSMGDRWGCGLREDGHVQCWGSYVDGALWPHPLETFSMISLDSDWGCGITTLGDLLCWGRHGGPDHDPRP